MGGTLWCGRGHPQRGPRGRGGGARGSASDRWRGGEARRAGAGRVVGRRERGLRHPPCPRSESFSPALLASLAPLTWNVPRSGPRVSRLHCATRGEFSRLLVSCPRWRSRRRGRQTGRRSPTSGSCASRCGGTALLLRREVARRRRRGLAARAPALSAACHRRGASSKRALVHRRQVVHLGASPLSRRA